MSQETQSTIVSGVNSLPVAFSTAKCDGSQLLRLPPTEFPRSPTPSATARSQQKMIECMKKAASLMISDDLELGLMILYSYDYFFLTHKCVSDFLEMGEISEQNMNNLFNEVHKTK